MNKIRLKIILLLFVTGSVFGQSDLCFENLEGSYLPIKIGHKLKYTSRGESYSSYFNGDSLKFGDNYYFKEISEYAKGRKKETYWREKDGIVYYYDTEKKAESVELINNLTPGTTWEKYDKTWKYTIIDTVSSFSSPFCDFRNLLQVKAEPQNEIKQDKYSVYNLFYKRGLGMVGLSVNGVSFTFIQPDKELNDKNFISYGCEKLTSESESEKCTYDKIYEFIGKNYKAPKKKNYKSGRIVLNLIIDKDGRVEDVKIIETIPEAELQEIEAVRVIRMLPKFIPAQFDDGQPVRSSIKIPIKF